MTLQGGSLAIGTPAPLCLRFRSAPLEIRGALERVADWLRAQRPESPPARDLELVLAELLNNISDHSYEGALGPIRLLLSRTGDWVHCSIEDEGKPLEAKFLPTKCRPVPLPDRDRLPERGYGWVMVRKLARDFDFERCEGRNRLGFRVLLSFPEVEAKTGG